MGAEQYYGGGEGHIGRILPGVTVEAASPVLIEKVRSVVTDESGVYRIVDLRPGTYTVTFTLPGFNTFRRDGVVLPSEFTATVNADLTVGQLEETITVTGEAPVVDIRSSRAQVQLAQETLQSLPGAGRLNMVSMVLPGATLRRESDRGVGGLSDRTQTAYSVHGAPEAQPIMDGMNHQIASLTSGTFVYNQINLQEVVVETSGVGADRDTGGMQLNMISKDGGNIFSGSATFAYVGPSLETSNITDELLARALDPQRVGSVKKFRDSAFALGGPIKRDQALVLRRGPGGRDAAVRGGRVLQQAHPTGIAALRARLEQAGVHRRLLQGLQCSIHVAGGGEAQDRARELLPAELQLRLQPVEPWCPTGRPKRADRITTIRTTFRLRHGPTRPPAG